MVLNYNTPAVQLVGDVEHRDFRDAVELLRTESRLVTDRESLPELIIVAQSRPDAICSDQLDYLRRAAPLAGIVALLGSWCEGESRTGRPSPGVHRLYWPEFPAWWRRQLDLRATHRCPDWARPSNQVTRFRKPGRPRSRSGLIVLQTSRRDNADALVDVLRQAGYSTAWQPPDRPRPHIRGAVAGVWDGGQLSDGEASDLSTFCTHMSDDGAPVLALFDFPRRDRVDLALEVGATVVLGKPWFNSDLLSTLDRVVEVTRVRCAA